MSVCFDARLVGISCQFIKELRTKNGYRLHKVLTIITNIMLIIRDIRNTM